MKMIQVRNVPDDVHRELKMSAAAKGITLSQLVYDAVVKHAKHQRAWAEFYRELDKSEPVDLPSGSGAAAVREAREENDRRHGAPPG